jgi:hypothetical protein
MTFSISQAQASALRQHRIESARRLPKNIVRHRPLPVKPQHFEAGGHSVARIRMIVSPWFRDENGFLTRTVTGA